MICKIITFVLSAICIITIDVLLLNILMKTKLECEIENVNLENHSYDEICWEVFITYTYPTLHCENKVMSTCNGYDESKELYLKLKNEDTMSCYNTGQPNKCKLEISGDFIFVNEDGNDPSSVGLYYLTYIGFIIFICFTLLLSYEILCLVYDFYRKKRYVNIEDKIWLY